MSEIDDLKAQITILMNQRDLYRYQIEEMRTRYEKEILKISRERDAYKKTCIKFAEQIESSMKKNPRNAGRKKYDKKWSNRYMQFSILMDEKKTMKEVMESLSISRATYFRLKKIYEQDLVFDESTNEFIPKAK